MKIDFDYFYYFEHMLSTKKKMEAPSICFDFKKDKVENKIIKIYLIFLFIKIS